MKYRKLYVWLGIILFWTLLTIPSFNLVNDNLVPSPYQVFMTFIDILFNGYNSISFFNHLGASFGRLFLSILLAVITAVPLGLISGYIKKIVS